MKESPIPPIPTSSSASALAGIAALVQMRRLPSRTSLALLRQSVNTGATVESLDRLLWAKTLTHFLDPQSESHWRCWPQTVSRHIFNEMTALRQLRSFRTLFFATTEVGRMDLQ